MGISNVFLQFLQECRHCLTLHLVLLSIFELDGDYYFLLSQRCVLSSFVEEYIGKNIV